MLNALGKKLTASLLSVIMLFALLPTGALASGGVVALDEVRQYLNISSNRFDKAPDQNKALKVLVKDTQGVLLAEGKTDVYVDALEDFVVFHGYDISVSLSPANSAAYEIVSVTGNGVDSYESGAATVHYRQPSVELQEDCKQLEVTLEKRAYPVAFRDEDDTSHGSQSVPYGELATAPTPAPEKDGYTFQGWYAPNAQAPFDFATPITADLTLTAKWQKEELPPVDAPKDAWFFIRTDGMVPMENGSTSYPTNEYLPTHGKEGALTGTITKESSWTKHYGDVDGDTINGEKLSDAFAKVQTAIGGQPADNSIKTALANVGFDPETQDIMWYVVKKAGSGSSGCPGYHVDGVLYTKGSDPTQMRVINYLSNIPDDADPLLAYSVHGLGTTAAVGDLIPTRKGYDFTGWNTQADGQGTAYAAGAELLMDVDHTLYAQWKLKTTAVGVWHYFTSVPTQDIEESGTFPRSDNRFTEEYIERLAKETFSDGTNTLHVTYTGYTVWAYRDGAAASVEVTLDPDGYVDLTGVKELRIHLEYELSLYKVIYNANGGANADGKVALETPYNTANGHTILDNAGDGNPNFTRGGYTFTGWAKDMAGSETVAVGTPADALEQGQSATYYAQWRKDEDPAPTTYTVTYQYTGSVPSGMTPPVDSARYVAEAEVTLATAPAAPANYTFTGWTISNGSAISEGKFTMPAGNVTVTGNWTYTEPSGGGTTPSRYTVTVNYLEQGTHVKLADAYVSARLTGGTAYNVTEQTALPIRGYTIASVDGAPSGTLRKNETITVYYVAEQNIPDEAPPLTPGPDSGETDIPDTDVPTAPAPDTDESDNTGTPDGNPGDDIIIEEDVPLGDLPQTGTTAQGVDPTITLGFLALAASLAAAGLSVALNRKKKDEI